MNNLTQTLPSLKIDKPKTKKDINPNIIQKLKKIAFTFFFNSYKNKHRDYMT